MFKGLAQFCVTLLDLFEQSYVLDGNHRLIGEGFEELDLRRSKGAHFDATRVQQSNEFSPLTKRSVQESTPAACGTQHWEIVLRIGVGNVERAVFAHPANVWLIDTDLSPPKGYRTKMGTHSHSVFVAQSQHHVIYSANPGGALDDGVKHRLHVRRRAADDAEHFSRCGLMLQRLAQLCVAFLDFLE